MRHPFRLLGRRFCCSWLCLARIFILSSIGKKNKSVGVGIRAQYLGRSSILRSETSSRVPRNRITHQNIVAPPSNFEFTRHTQHSAVLLFSDSPNFRPTDRSSLSGQNSLTARIDSHLGFIVPSALRSQKRQPTDARRRTIRNRCRFHVAGLHIGRTKFCFRIHLHCSIQISRHYSFHRMHHDGFQRRLHDAIYILSSASARFVVGPGSRGHDEVINSQRRRQR